MKKIYKTKRLVMKLPELSDAKAILDYFLRNREFLAKFEPVRDKDFYTLRSFEDMINLDKILYDNCQALKYWIYKNDKVIGSVGLNNIIWGVFLNGYIGYRLDKDEINKGYMTEALQKLIEIAFDDLRLHRLEANIMPRNKASLSVVKKAGFEFEGIAKEYLKINGIWEDHVHMVLLNKKLL